MRVLIDVQKIVRMTLGVTPVCHPSARKDRIPGVKVFIAGASSDIGKPLLRCPDEAGHETFALVRSAEAAGTLEAKSAQEVVASALDAASVLEVVQHTKPDVIVNELTSLPKHYTPEEMKAAAARDKEVRVKRKANLPAGRARNKVRPLRHQTPWSFETASESAANIPSATARTAQRARKRTGRTTKSTVLGARAARPTGTRPPSMTKVKDRRI